MIGFVVGLIVGAIAGVIADRIWGWLENQPRLQLKISYFMNARGERGLRYSVRNVGSSEIPDYKIAIFHPRRGTLFNFPSEQSGSLLPDQTRSHQCPMIRNGSPDQFLRNWIMTERDTPVENIEFDEFSLRLVMENSNRILFESSTMGNAIARMWHRTVTTGEWGKSTWQETQAMCSSPPFGFKYWLERRREKKEINKLLAAHKNAK